DVEEEPGNPGGRITQRHQQNPQQPEPGGIVVGEEVVDADSGGSLVPAMFLLDKGLKLGVIRALTRGQELTRSPVADEVRKHLVPRHRCPPQENQEDRNEGERSQVDDGSPPGGYWPIRHALFPSGCRLRRQVRKAPSSVNRPRGRPSQ